MNDSINAEIEAKVLSVSVRPYVGSDGQNRTARNVLIQKGANVLEFSLSETAEQSVKALEGKEAVLVVQFVRFGRNFSAVPQIASAVEPT